MSDTVSNLQADVERLKERKTGIKQHISDLTSKKEELNRGVRKLAKKMELLQNEIAEL